MHVTTLPHQAHHHVSTAWSQSDSTELAQGTQTLELMSHQTLIVILLSGATHTLKLTPKLQHKWCQTKLGAFQHIRKSGVLSYRKDLTVVCPPWFEDDKNKIQILISFGSEDN